jgi:glycosyltransferase involved in cell wall biosynthesis
VVSVIIAAHNEEAVIGGCLEALAREQLPLQVIVSANGCTDATAELARSMHATVVERAEAGKAGALNAAELVAEEFPRIYLDADIVPPPGAIAALVAALGVRRVARPRPYGCGVIAMIVICLSAGPYFQKIR